MTTHTPTTSPKQSNNKDETPVEHVSYAEKKRHLDELLAKFRTGFLVSHAQAGDPDAHYHARPMALLDRDDAGDLWFATSIGSPKVSEVEADPKVLVTFQDGARFVAVTGHALVVRDRKKVDEIWGPEMKAWFPDGKDDPDLVLLKVDAREAAFWDASGTRGLKYLFRAAKALVTGERPEGERTEKDNAKLKL